MDENANIDEAYKRAFNLGYRLAQELDLRAPMLTLQEKVMATDPMHLGMQQYINEAKLGQGKDRAQGTKKGPDKGRGPSL